MLSLRPHQSEVVEKLRDGFRNGHRCQLLYAPTGFGKTEVAMSIMHEVSKGFKKAAMVLDRIVLVDQTSLRLSKYNISHGVMMSGHWRYRPHERIQVCSAQTLERRNAEMDIDLLIIDECFLAGTKISTPKGLVDIDKVRVGDVIFNQRGHGVVEAISVKSSDDLYTLEFDDGTRTTCTGNHPYFTSSGWKTARELEVGESFFSEQGMRLLWEYVQTMDKKDGERENCKRHSGENMAKARMLFDILLKEIEEPDEQSSGKDEAKSSSKRNYAQAYKTWRERALASFATVGIASCARRGVGGGTRCKGGNGSGEWLSNLLQNRYCESSAQNCSRGGWGEPHGDRKTECRSEEGRISCFPRLVRISRVEPTCSRPVYNLQVSGHPSYFADGKLVHNCHVQRASTIKLIKENPKIKVIGLTATPFTKGLGEVYTHVVGAKSTGDLIKDGWLTPLRVFNAKESDMTGAKKVAGEWSPDQVAERGMKITGDIVAEWIKQTNRIFGKPVKTVVFCAGVAHGKDLQRQFKEQGYNFVSISYKEDDEFKRESIEEFAKPDSTIHGLIATDILTRGFDVPDVLIGVSARPFSKSFSSHVQQMGRVMRPFDGKKFGVWLDHSGNYLRFRNDWEKLFEEGVTELTKEGEKAKKEPTEKEKKESKCPACSALWISKDNICAICGYQRPVKSVASVAGELHELDDKSANMLEDRQSFYSELLYYSRMRGYKDGWVAHKYKEKFGVFPRGVQQITVPTSNKTARWIQSRNIAWANSKTRPRA